MPTILSGKATDCQVHTSNIQNTGGCFRERGVKHSSHDFRGLASPVFMLTKTSCNPIRGRLTSTEPGVLSGMAGRPF